MVPVVTTPIFGLFFYAMFVPFARPLGVWIGTVLGTVTAVLIAFSGPIVVHLAQEHGVDSAVFGVELTTIDDGEGGFKTVTAVAEVNRQTGDTELVPRDPISFQWIGPVALAVNLLIGTLVCYFLPRKKPPPKALKEKADGKPPA